MFLLSLPFGQTHLFPKLDHLFWSLHRSLLFPYITLFWCPAVIQIWLGMEHEDSEQDPRVVDATSELCLWLRRVRRLSVGRITQAAMEHLLGLPNINDLDEMSRLQFLRVRLPESAVAADVGSFYVLLASSIQPKSVVGLHVTSSSASQTSPEGAQNTDGVSGFDAEVALNMNRLRTLFVLANLTGVTLQISEGFGLDDATIVEVAAAWSHLTRLELTEPMLRPAHTPRLTLVGLRALARRCSGLSVVKIGVNALNVGLASSNRQDEWLCAPRLQQLTLSYSPLTNPGEVALFLTRAFPELAERLGPSTPLQLHGSVGAGRRLSDCGQEESREGG
ncbi:hypothetical protein B0H11DRAFT_2239500 [Mycena galericulata]|nr:hypothetical protein B0H11DRAFT_2239500 [Mycena galericulata]